MYDEPATMRAVAMQVSSGMPFFGGIHCEKVERGGKVSAGEDGWPAVDLPGPATTTPESEGGRDHLSVINDQ